jgi:hypothetical protein
MDREEDPVTETEELQRRQGQREAAERREAETATEDAETAQHERRADKAAYLREKLEERAQAEREAAEEDGE